MTSETPLLPPLTKRSEQAAVTRQKLIDAAASLFAQHGYDASSVAAIGERAGVSRGLVNFHFNTKQNLLHAVIEQLVAELEQGMFPDEQPADPLAALALSVDAHRRFMIERPERARLLFRLQAEALNPARGLTAFAELHERWLDRTRLWWERGLESGQIDPALDHNAVTTFAIGAMRGIALEWLLAPEALDVDAAYAHMLRSLLLGLSSSVTPIPDVGQRTKRSGTREPVACQAFSQPLWSTVDGTKRSSGARHGRGIGSR